jgi:hypothetical protein
MSGEPSDSKPSKAGAVNGEGKFGKGSLVKEEILWRHHFGQGFHEVAVSSVDEAWVLIEESEENVGYLLYLESQLLLLELQGLLGSLGLLLLEEQERPI